MSDAPPVRPEGSEPTRADDSVPDDSVPDDSVPDDAVPDDSVPDDAVRSRRGLNRTATVLIGTLLAILGFALAVQFRSNASTDSLSTAREDDLVRILDDQNSRIERLQGQISDLQTAKSNLSDSGSNNAAARQEAQSQADALAVLAGTAPAHGPGIQVLITDPDHALKAEDLLDVVEELRGAGAEVIQFGSVRVGTASAFTDGPGGVVLDGTTLSAPYTVLAIGDAKTMDTALNIPTGVVSSVRSAGGQAEIAEKDLIEVTAVRPVSKPKYATSTNK